jgi:hypothetical protein
LKNLYRKTRRSNLAKCERTEEVHLILGKQRFANRNKRTSLTKRFWNDKSKSENNHKHTVTTFHMHSKHGTVRSEIRTTIREDQILLQTNILPNLCRDIGFEQVSRKWPASRQHQDHYDTIMNTHTKSWMTRGKTRKTVHVDEKLLQTNILPNLCRDIDFEKVSRKWPESRQHQDHHAIIVNTHTKSWMMREKYEKQYHAMVAVTG